MKQKQQEKQGKYGHFQLSQFTMFDADANSIDVKSYRQKAISDASKYEEFRGVEVIFATKDVSRSELRYNNANNKYFIKNPVRVTMTPSNEEKTLAGMKFESKLIEQIQAEADCQVKKVNISGIVTEIENQQFKQNEGLVLRINDTSGTQRHVFYEKHALNTDLIKQNEFIFILNANVQERDGYINCDGGIPLDANVFKSLKKKQKQMNQMQENDALYKWQPKECDFNQFTLTSVKKLDYLTKKCKSQGVELELKEKYQQILLENVQIIDFVNLCDATYQSLKNDRKCRKIKEDQLETTDAKNIINVWKLNVIISNGDYEHELAFFNVMGDALMDVTAQQWFSMDETKKQRVVDVSMESSFNIYLTLKKKEYAKDKFSLRENVVRIEQR